MSRLRKKLGDMGDDVRCRIDVRHFENTSVMPGFIHIEEFFFGKLPYYFAAVGDGTYNFDVSRQAIVMNIKLDGMSKVTGYTESIIMPSRFEVGLFPSHLGYRLFHIASRRILADGQTLCHDKIGICGIYDIIVQYMGEKLFQNLPYEVKLT